MTLLSQVLFLYLKALYYIELPYMEDMRELEFPTLPVSAESSSKNAPDQEQLDAVDDLITCMEIPSGCVSDWSV